MKRIYQKTMALFMAGVLLLTGSTALALPYRSYIYDAYKEPVYAPDVYVPSKVINGNTLGVGDFNEPSDIFYNGKFYIVDSLNNRIVITDKEFKSAKVLSEFRNGGRLDKLNKPSNIFVTADGKLYISDYGNKRIVISDEKGNIESVITKPDNMVYPQERDFAPMDLVVSSSGMLYVIADGIYQGTVVFDSHHDFKGFFGSNQVEVTLEVLMNNVWKKLATKEQRKKLERNVPVQYSSLAIDSEDFVYATVPSAKDASTRVRKLNPNGQNILVGADDTEIFFGDPESYVYKGEISTTILNAIDVVDDKIITVLDRKNKKLYQYDQNGRLITIFGGEGSCDGVFSDPVAACAFDTYVVVLDTQKKNLTIFDITDYGKIMLKAIDIYSDGLYAESVDYWKEVLKYNSNSGIANLGYGKALYQMGDYQQAMEYFEKANDKTQYSAAYKEYRKSVLRDNFTLLVVLVVSFIVCAFAVIKWKLYRFIARAFRRAKGGAKI